MKKTICLILAICMIIGIKSYCFAFDTTDQSFSATVITCRYIEATDKYSFCAVGDIYGNGRRDPFTFGISREYVMTSHLFSETLVGNLEMGQIITVYFNGEVMESYPMQIVADMVFVEDEIEELTEDEKLGYLSMFYSEEWLIENGYMEVPPTESEAVAPEIDCDEDTTLPSEPDEEDIDTDDGGEVPIENYEKVTSSDKADCETEDSESSHETVLWIIGCSAIIIISVTAIAVITKKK